MEGAASVHTNIGISSVLLSHLKKKIKRLLSDIILAKASVENMLIVLSWQGNTV